MPIAVKEARQGDATDKTMAKEDDYKGYGVTLSAKLFSSSGAYSPIFHVHRKRGEHRELVHTGEVKETFSNANDAFRAAYEAAGAWIDEHGQQ